MTVESASSKDSKTWNGKFLWKYGLVFTSLALFVSSNLKIPVQYTGGDTRTTTMQTTTDQHNKVTAIETASTNYTIRMLAETRQELLEHVNKSKSLEREKVALVKKVEKLEADLSNNTKVMNEVLMEAMTNIKNLEARLGENTKLEADLSNNTKVMNKVLMEAMTKIKNLEARLGENTQLKADLSNNTKVMNEVLMEVMTKIKNLEARLGENTMEGSRTGEEDSSASKEIKTSSDIMFVDDKNNKTQPLSFYLIHTTAEDTFGPGNVRSIESVFYHHPDAQVSLYHKDPNFTARPVQAIIDAGYNLTLHQFNLAEMLKSIIEKVPGNSTINTEVANKFISNIPKYEKTKFWYANEANILRQVLLYINGGIYLDTDMIVVKKVDGLRNCVGKEKNGGNNAVLIFDQGNPFQLSVLNEIFSSFKPIRWGNNGPKAIARTIEKDTTYKDCAWSKSTRPCLVNILPEESFYPMNFSEVASLCFGTTSDHSEMKAKIESSSYMVHTNNKVTKEFWEENNGHTLPNSLCRWLYNSFCVVCGDTPL